MIAAALEWLGFTAPARHRRTSFSTRWRSYATDTAASWLWQGVTA